MVDIVDYSKEGLALVSENDTRSDEMLEQLIKRIKEWIDQEKTGSIQINFFKGGVANIVKKESEKLKDNTTKKGGSYGVGRTM